MMSSPGHTRPRFAYGPPSAALHVLDGRSRDAVVEADDWARFETVQIRRVRVADDLSQRPVGRRTALRETANGETGRTAQEERTVRSAGGRVGMQDRVALVRHIGGGMVGGSHLSGSGWLPKEARQEELLMANADMRCRGKTMTKKAKQKIDAVNCARKLCQPVSITELTSAVNGKCAQFMRDE